MINKVTKVKLGVFVAITVLALSLTALQYVRLPQQVGIGRFGVDVELAAAGGLYPQATVTYRGVEVGKVTDVALGERGKVVARLQIDDGVEIPRESTAEVRSSSVIGEQYVNFVPHPDRTNDSPLQEGDVVPVERTVLPTTTDTLLTSVHGLLRSLPQEDLRTVVREAGNASLGVGDEFGTLIADSREFQRAARANLPATTKLLEDSQPVLRTQRALDPNIRSYARNLASLTTSLRAADSQLRGVLATGAPFMRQVGAFADDLGRVVPGMLGELANTGEVLRVFRNNIEHVLILAPAVLPAVNGVIPPGSMLGERNVMNLSLKATLEPPPCTVGFKDAENIRHPSDTSIKDPSTNDWCKVPSADPRAARGARNVPCPNGGRAPTARACGLVFSGSVADRYARTGERFVGVSEAPAPRTRGARRATPTSFLLSGDAPNPLSLTDLLTGLVLP